jgi:hypothetical protein
MAKVLYKGGKWKGVQIPPCWIMDGTEAWELFHAKPGKKDPKQKSLDEHMAEMDAKWRKSEGRKPYAELTERERLMEHNFTQPAWNALLAKEAVAQESEQTN